MDPGIFKEFFSIARRGIFPQFSSYFWKNGSDVTEDFTGAMSLDKGVPLNLEVTLIRNGLWIWTTDSDRTCFVRGLHSPIGI